MNNKRWYFIIAVLFTLSACATAPEQKPEPPAVREVPGAGDDEVPYIVKRGDYTPTESEINSLKIFNQIYRLTRSSRDRSAVLPEIEALYLKIITEYPDAPLAQESYWRLMTLYMRDYSPPAFDRAETLYAGFLQGKENPAIRGLLVETLGKGYYRYARWEELLSTTAIELKEYREDGEKPRPSLVFLNAEAYYNLGNMEEAEKGYRMLAEVFPQSSEGKMAKKRLEEIRNKR
jgi:tetratricopeptide (TPR) repeat protein